tara:strand:+ start:278 stop:454 length:177 start_codon:yes stop_codon:yes gene_type:complete
MKTEEIKDLLTLRGIKHSWVAKKIGYSSAYFSMVINGFRKTPKDFSDKVINAINNTIK